MKGNREILAESFKLLTGGRWFWRLLTVTAILMTLQNLANGSVASLYERFGVQTWLDFLVRKAEAMQSGLGYAVPSSAVAASMNYATAFAAFIALVFGGITHFGMAAVALKAVRNDDDQWCHASLGGLERPLGVAWLGFCELARIALWSLLFVVPGIVAAYGYSQCWFLRVEHPDWSVGRCLSESAKLMQGVKLRRFVLDLSFGAIALAMAVSCVGLSLIGIPAVAVGMLCGIFLLIWMSLARCVFYQALAARKI